MSDGEDIRDRFAAMLEGLGDDPGGGLEELRAAGHELIAAFARADAMLEMREQQVEAQYELITSIGFPVLQVRTDTLCAPLIGNFDGRRAGKLAQTLLTMAVERRVRTVVIDMTGAMLLEEQLVELLTRVFQALRLIGVRGLLSGVGPEAAARFARAGDGLRGVPCFLDLSSALAADQGGASRRAKW